VGGREGDIRNGGKEEGGHGLRGGGGGLSPSFKGGWKALKAGMCDDAWCAPCT